MYCFSYKDPFSLKLIFFLYVDLYFTTSESHTLFHNLNILNWAHRQTLRIDNHKAHGMTHLAANHFKAMSDSSVKIHFKQSMSRYIQQVHCVFHKGILISGDKFLEDFELSSGLIPLSIFPSAYDFKLQMWMNRADWGKGQ